MPDTLTVSEIPLQQPSCHSTVNANLSNYPMPADNDRLAEGKRTWDSSFSPVMRHHHSDTSDAQSTGSQESDSGKKPGRRPMTDDVFDEDEDPKVKRKAQNRAAQRAFRERKERYVKELEKKIKYIQDSHLFATSQLVQENQHLRSAVFQLQTENAALKGLPMDQQWLPYPQQSHPPLRQPAPAAVPAMHSIDTQSSAAGQGAKPVAILPQYNNNRMRLFPAEPTPSPSPPSSVSLSIEQPHQFTFSISTPATLRQTQQSFKSGAIEPIELVPLYPDHRHPASQHQHEQQKQQQQQPQQQQQRHQNTTQHEPSSPKPQADKNKEDYPLMDHYDTINMFLSEPMLFQGQEELNEMAASLSSHKSAPRDEKVARAERSSEQEALAVNAIVASSVDSNGCPTNAIPKPASSVWKRINQHASTHRFNVNQLLEAVKNSNGHGPSDGRLIHEWDIETMIQEME